MPTQIHEFADQDLLATALADFVAETLDRAIHESGEASFVLAGGKTPGLTYQELAHKHVRSLAWQSVHFFWGDERCVPPVHPHSNFGLAQEGLLRKLPVWQEKVHRMRGEMDPHTEALRYAVLLDELFEDQLGEGTVVFDLVLLGLGQDMHTASLFPHDSVALHSSQTCIVVENASATPLVARLTLTPRVLSTAQCIVFMVCGAEKHQALDRTLNCRADDESTPAGMIAAASANVHWFVDSAALRGSC